MIKVIKHGQQAHYGSCPKCLCEFAYTDDEIKTHWENVRYSTIIMGKNGINCPECGEWIEIHNGVTVLDTNTYYGI